MEIRDSTYAIRRTTEFEAMRLLARSAGLEESANHDFAVAYGCFSGQQLVGCAGLKDADGVFTVECLAVEERFRHEGIGRSLVLRIEQEAKERGAKGIWAVARAPGFFFRLGYAKTDPAGGGRPSMKGCESCPQFQKTCSPELVFKAF